MSEKSALPPLYKAARALDRRADATLRIRAPENARFAARQNLFPLTMPEFAEASRCAPIVFLRVGEGVRAFMVAGSAPGSNLLMDAEGRWRSGAYVPAYVRRYPFILIDTPQGRRLGIDPEAPHLSRVEGEALFDDGAPSAAIERAQAFCAAFDAAWRATERLCADLVAADMLVPAVTTLTRAGFDPQRVDGFEMVGPEALSQLEPAVLAEWERSRQLAAVHAHRASLARWKDVAALPAAA